jgi:thiol-disulfide isomerase/thioredoxin
VNKTLQTLPNNKDYVLHEIETCLKQISNQKVLNYFLINETELKLEHSKKFEKVYELFMTNCTNKRYKKSAKRKFQIYKNTRSGNPSPKFSNYKTYGGGTTSLVDLRGKYVYLDIWATWCGPCIKEIPALKKLKEEYQNKNIKFVSISVDKKKNYDEWKNMVEEKKLKGIQLFANNGFNSQFVQDYGITAIPRFILIDKKGNIINADAPRPSDPRLETMLDSLF